jgi:hypothetical protein
MFERLIKDFQEKSSLLTQKEITKTTIEISSLDLSSKETMVKLCTSLKLSNIDYFNLCNEIDTMKAECAVIEKKLSIIERMISAGILKTPEQIDNFVKNIS